MPSRALLSIALSLGLSSLSLLVGCAGRLPDVKVTRAPRVVEPASEPEPEPERRTPTTRRVDLEYELQGKPFSSPLVRAAIGDKSMWLVVDTGASYHALSGWLASDLRLGLTRGQSGLDHIGHEIQMSVIERASIESDGWGMLRNQPLLVAEVPGAFRDLNIGGFLAPQFLAKGNDRVLVDLERSELTVVSGAEAAGLMATRGGRFPIGASRICRSNEAVPYRAFVVPGFVDDEPVNLLVDTGAAHTNLRIGSIAGQKMMAMANGDRVRIFGAGGAFSALAVPSARVRIGEVGSTTDIDLVPGSPNPDCPSDGVVGMDILRSCVLSMSEKGPLEGRCTLPTTPAMVAIDLRD